MINIHIKLIFWSLFLLTFVATCASAGGMTTEETVMGKITHYYKTIEVRRTDINKVCKNVEVPIYGESTGGATAGDVFKGIIIGGLIGKGATGDSDGTTAGAIIGGMMAADKKKKGRVIIGYKLTRVCEDVPSYTSEYQRVYDYSIIRFRDKNNQLYELKYIFT